MFNESKMLQNLTHCKPDITEPPNVRDQKTHFGAELSTSNTKWKPRTEHESGFDMDISESEDEQTSDQEIGDYQLVRDREKKGNKAT